MRSALGASAFRARGMFVDLSHIDSLRQDCKPPFAGTTHRLKLHIEPDDTLTLVHTLLLTYEDKAPGARPLFFGAQIPWDGPLRNLKPNDRLIFIWLNVSQCGSVPGGTSGH